MRQVARDRGRVGEQGDALAGQRAAQGGGWKLVERFDSARRGRLDSGECAALPPPTAAFGYRDSVFKRNPASRVAGDHRVRFRLPRLAAR
jgi:UDP-N-acetylenolpyruvoylglucosamine reductase